MSKFDEKVAFYQEAMEKLGLFCDYALLEKITKGLGPSIFKRDAESVSASDEKELETVKNNFLIKKLSLEDSPVLDKAIQTVAEKMGKTNRVKYRAIFYYLLVEELDQESKFL